jgi:uncharacterized membrane protein YphA (DoxX/SURF4 family)
MPVKTRSRRASRRTFHAPRSEAAGLRALWSRAAERLLAPIDIASLVFFRIFFGVIAFWHVWQQMPLVKAEYIDPDFHFKYLGFGWVEPLPGQLMHVVFLVMAASAILIALGLFYRAAAVTFFVLHTYVLLIDVSNYWNHYYLITLIAFLIIFVPANRAFSLDVARGAVDHSDETPAWALWILPAQMGIVYFFAGLAKATSSDWLHGRPMDYYLSRQADFPIVGGWFTDDWMVYLISYSGLFLDLLVFPLLLWPRTRVPAACLAIGFHLANSLILPSLQVFPWLAIVLTLLFLSPSWPRLAGQWSPLSAPISAAVSSSRRDRQSRRRLPSGGQLIAGVLAFFFLLQILIPLRQFAYPDPGWTREGHLFSWRMFVSRQNGSTVFTLRDKRTGDTCSLNAYSYVYAYQSPWLPGPDVMIQFARHVAARYKALGADVEVHAWTDFSLNGRSKRLLVDPEVDLASVGRTLGHHDWLQDLDDPTRLERPTGPRCADPPPLPGAPQVDEEPAGIDGRVD